ncbi:recombinase family protein [Psychroflexus salarius]|uniref:recombinase family protein n=1 Tax=Psychroflexus salarius TaxID=1155689 RepID=UPI0009331DF7|nr:recombinase family protein [Psychroflexus salarius]
MKNVILYVRVSTDEQADKGFSLRDQEEKLKAYCKTNHLSVLKVYREDYSAKTFERPEMKKLIAYCKQHQELVDELLFVKWDRFSRNTSESYNTINLFTSLGIRPNAIEQPLDLSIPEQGLMLAVYLSVPEVENMRRSQNVIAGMRRALKEGRYVGSPPKGYFMGRDSSNRPVLTPNKDAKYIQKGFEMMLTNVYNQKDVYRALKAEGFETSSTAFYGILRNSLYCGWVHIKAYKDEPEDYIEGIHEPLITKSDFDKVQSILKGRRRQSSKPQLKVNSSFPLRGFVLCPKCDKVLTASTSKGRSKRYSYYHCSTSCGVRLKKEDVHAWFESYLKSISLDENAYQLLSELIEKEFKQLAKKRGIGPKHYEKKRNLETKLERIQELYIDGDLTKDEFKQAKNRIQKLIKELEEKEKQFANKASVEKVYKEGLKGLQDFDKHYLNSDIEHKRLMIGSIFPEKFTFQDEKVRTADINPALLKIMSVNKGLQRIKKKDKSKINDLSSLVGPPGLEPGTF